MTQQTNIYFIKPSPYFKDAKNAREFLKLFMSKIQFVTVNSIHS